MLLEDKVAIVYGAGAIGGAVARAFSREGAVVHLADHNDPSAKKVATDLRDAGAKLENRESQRVRQRRGGGVCGLRGREERSR